MITAYFIMTKKECTGPTTAGKAKCMKKIILALTLTVCAQANSASDIAIIGLLKQMTVAGSDMRVIARHNYIFTNRKLEGQTVFSGLRSSGGDFYVACCFIANDKTPLSLETELKRYRLDRDFVADMKSVKGYSYIYEGRPAPKSIWSQEMKNIMEYPPGAYDSAPYSVPVIAAQFDKSMLPPTFEVEGKKLN
jgi:hypothetical protein